MNDLIAGFGFVLVIEGLLWALAPGLARRMLHEMAEVEPERLRVAALVFVAAGVFVVWLARG